MRKVILPALLLFCSLSASAQSAKKPELVLKDVHGRSFSLSDYKNKIVLLNFWATWCPPCRTEIPDLIKKQTQYRDQGLRIIGITYPPEKVTEVRRFMRKTKMNYRVVIGTKAIKALFTSSETLPMTVVIGRDGTVREVIEGVMFSDEFDEKVRPLLSTQSGRPVRESRLTLHREYFKPSPR
jgi:thiol-disulfide isomerase/thioredoxin